MKSTSIRISLDKRRAKSDGTYPIILRLTHNGQSTSIKTGISIPEKFWDEDACQVKASFQGTTSVKRLNNELQKKKAEALDNILKLDDQAHNTTVPLTGIRRKVSPEAVSFSFYDYTSKLIQDLITSGRIGTARSYKGVVSVLKTYNKGKPLEKNKGGDPIKSRNHQFSSKFKNVHYRDLSFHEINYSFLSKFEHYHLASGNEVNGLAVYMRTIRSIYNQAIKENLIDRALYPFDEYKIKTAPTKKRALDQEHIKKIISLKLEAGDAYFDARNYFVASYLMYGMNFADMAHLRKTDCINGRIQYRRRKTSKLYDIKITENLREILGHYQKTNADSAYIFPIIKRESAEHQEKDIQSARKLFNKNLKSIAAICGIEQKLTSYVSRHSFATNALMNNIPVNAISAMLGHSSIKTTEIYLKGLPSSVLDNYNKLIIS